MTAADDSKYALVQQLGTTWHSTAAVLAAIEDAQWRQPTDCPGWSVQDVVAHVIGTESMLAGHAAPRAAGDGWGGHVRNDIGALNEAWVDARRSSRPDSVLEELRSVTAERLRALEAMTEEDFDVPGWTPVGQAPYRRFMQIRVFDCWVHEQDIRRALCRPGDTTGPAAEAALDEVERSLGYVVGKRAGAPAGSRITFRLSGGTPRVLHVATDARSLVVAEIERPADVTVEVDSTDFVALACGRLTAGEVQISCVGDETLGTSVMEHLAFTI